MKENTKIIIACVITLILGTIINVTATTMLQANSISYKTSNGDTTDVNSALDRLFDAADINGRLGNTDISSIGDGTITGSINELNIKENQSLKYITLLYSGYLSKGTSFKLAENISNYKFLRLVNEANEKEFCDMAIPTSNNSIIASIVSYVKSAEVMVLLDLGATSDDGQTYLVDRNVQVNISSSGISYFNDSQSSKWLIYGIR